jgi:hypothetical protein
MPEAIYSNHRPDYMSDETADWLESLRDVNGVPVATVEAIIERAEDEYATWMGNSEAYESTGCDQARYNYLRFAGVGEDIADMYRSGIQK